jgi:hypothetical protein
MVDLRKLTGYIVVEAALDELIFEGISHLAYLPPDVDWKPKEAWNDLQDVVS